LERIDLLARAGACILAGVPSTTLVPLPLTQLVTRRYRREALLKRLHAMVQWARFCREHILGIELSVAGREQLPADTRGCMYVSNHQSYIDILVLMEALDTVAFLSKSLVKYIPVIGRCAYAGGTVYMERGKQGSRQRALAETIRMCQESTAVVVFPEGTRSFDGELRQSIHPGGIRAAHREGLRVIPVGIDGTCRVVPKTMDVVHTGQRVAVTIGQPLDPKDFEQREAWVAAVWARVTELFEESRRRRQANGARAPSDSGDRLC
jgi:1-acyl-sn-glycerol-3-phosphate acyltransferase